MRTTRLRQKIKKFLDLKGEANTTEILEHVNSTMRHGTTPQQLGNVLSKDKDILKISPIETLQSNFQKQLSKPSKNRSLSFFSRFRVNGGIPNFGDFLHIWFIWGRINKEPGKL